MKARSGPSAHHDVAVVSLKAIPDATKLVLRGAYFLDAERGKGEGGNE